MGRIDGLLRVLRVAAPALAAALVPACIILEDTSGSGGSPTSSVGAGGVGTGSGGTGGGAVGGPAPMACPRAPDVGGTAPRELTADELARANEVCAWTTDLYQKQGWDVLYTVQMPSGDLYDYISAPMSPNDPTPPPPLSDVTLPLSFALMPSELDLYPNLRGPQGTMLRVRPDFSLYISGNTGATSLDDFLAHYLPAGAPAADHRLFAGINSAQPDNNKYTYNLGAPPG